MDYPKISIITPSYNQGQFIEETILSIINQGYPNLEYIIIDGGSTDNTVDIIKKYEKHIAYWVSEPDKGQSDAINKGIAVATGDVFNWINSDDYLEKGTLLKIGNLFKDSNVRIVCTATTLIYSNGQLEYNPPTNVSSQLFQVLASNSLNQMGMYWRMSFIKELQGVNPIFKYSMDLDLWKRYVFTNGNDGIIIDNCSTAFFRLHENSKTGVSVESNAIHFYRENNAAIRQYISNQMLKYKKAVDILFPDFDDIISNSPVYSKLNIDILENSIKEFIYHKIKQAFYAERFDVTRTLISSIHISDFTKEQQRNLKSWKRWSLLKKIFNYHAQNC